MTTAQITKRLAVMALVLLAAAPAWAGGKPKKAAPARDLVWPLPPDKPRIRLVGILRGAADVDPGKKAGFLDRLAGIEKKQFKPTFMKPYGVATDSLGRIYVTDSAQGLVFVFDQKNIARGDLLIGCAKREVKARTLSHSCGLSRNTAAMCLDNSATDG